MPDRREDPVLRRSRREALTAFVIWVCTFTYTITVCYLFGYNRPPESLTYVLGFPDWVFWGIVAPWIVCCGISTWFAFRFIKDADLGEDREEADRG